jgi:hypothetical protein
MDHHEEFEFNWQSKEHEVASDALRFVRECDEGQKHFRRCFDGSFVCHHVHLPPAFHRPRIASQVSR